MSNSSAIYFQTKFFSPPLQPWILKQIPKQTEPMLSRGQTNPWQISTKRPNPWDRHSWKKKNGRENKQAQAPLQIIENRNTDDVVLELAGWLACDKSKLCAFSLSLSLSLSLLHSIHNTITYMMLVGIGETLLLFPRQVHKSILGFLEIQNPGFFFDHEDLKIPTM